MKSKTRETRKSEPRSHRGTVACHGAAWLALGGLLLSAYSAGCCGGNCIPPLPIGEVARLKITPSSILLKGAGEKTRLMAEGWDKDGNYLGSIPADWSSSDEGMIRLSADGEAEAMAALGSAKIMASCNGISAEPALAIIAQPVAGAELVSDEKIMSDPEPVDPGATYGVGYRYRVRVDASQSLTIGGILLGTGEKPVGGRVVEVIEEGGERLVTLEIVPLDEMFEKVDIHQTLDLSKAEYAIDPEIEAAYNIATEPDGTMVLTPKAQVTGKEAHRAGAIGTHALASGCVSQGVVNFGIASAPSLRLQPNMNIQMDLDSQVKRFVVTGDPTLTLEFSPTMNPGFAGSISCKHVLKEIKIPVGGWLSLIFSGFLDLGWGYGFSGSVTGPPIGFDITGEIKASAKLGVEWSPAGAHMVNSLDGSTSLAFAPVVPDSPDLRIKVSAEAFAFAEVAFGPPFLKDLRFKGFNMKAGPKFTLDLATALSQALDPDYASNFSFAPVHVSAGAGSSVDYFQRMLAINFTELKIEGDLIPPVTSPTGGFTITPRQVRPESENQVGDKANFITVMDKTTFLGMPAMDRIEYYLLRSGDLERAPAPCDTVPYAVSSCETYFRREYVGEQKCYAFYKALLFGVPLPVPLEITQDSEVKVRVGDNGRFQGLGLPAGYADFDPDFVSRGGDVIVGTCREVEGNKRRAFRWSESTGMEILTPPELPREMRSIVGLSSNGSAFAGWTYNLSTSEHEACRWTRETGFQPLGFLGAYTGTNYHHSLPTAISADGSTVVGKSSSASQGSYAAFRWTQAGGMTALGTLSGGITAETKAIAVSADGTVVAGTSGRCMPNQYGSCDGLYEAVRWTASGAATSLGTAGVDYGLTESIAMSADGQVIAAHVRKGGDAGGECAISRSGAPLARVDIPLNDYRQLGYFRFSQDGSVFIGQTEDIRGNSLEAFRWTLQGGLRLLGSLPGGSSSWVTASSEDGGMVIGGSYEEGVGSTGFLWDPTNGIRRLTDALEFEFGMGPAMSGWQYLEAMRISGDGKVIVGIGRNPAGQYEAWRAVLP